MRPLWVLLSVSAILFVLSGVSTADDKPKSKAPKLTEFTFGDGEIEYFDYEISKMKLKYKEIKFEDHYVNVNTGNGKLQGMLNNAGGMWEKRAKQSDATIELSIAPSVAIYIYGPETPAPGKNDKNKKEGEAKKDEGKKEEGEKKEGEMKDGEKMKKDEEKSKTDDKKGKTPAKTGSSSAPKKQPPIKMAWNKAKSDQIVRGQTVRLYIAKSSDKNDPANYVTRIYVIPNSGK